MAVSILNDFSGQSYGYRNQSQSRFMFVLPNTIYTAIVEKPVFGARNAAFAYKVDVPWRSFKIKLLLLRRPQMDTSHKVYPETDAIERSIS